MKHLVLLLLIILRIAPSYSQPVDATVDESATESLNIPAVSLCLVILVLVLALFSARIAFIRYRCQQIPGSPPSLSTAFSFQSRLPTLSAHQFHEQKKAVKSSGYLVGMLSLPALEVHMKTSSDAMKWRKNRNANSHRTSLITKLHLDSRRRASRATMYLEDLLRLRHYSATTRTSAIEDTFAHDSSCPDTRGDISRATSLRLVSTPVSRPISLEPPLPCIPAPSFAFENLGPSVSTPLAPSIPENLLRYASISEPVKSHVTKTTDDCEIQQPPTALKRNSKSPLFSLFGRLDATPGNLECAPKDDLSHNSHPMTPPQLHVFSPSCRILHLDVQDSTNPNLANLSRPPSVAIRRVSTGSASFGRTISSLPCSATP
jgi:hypothetical protein